jgi:hypothetical protein
MSRISLLHGQIYWPTPTLTECQCRHIYYYRDVEEQWNSAQHWRHDADARTETKLQILETEWHDEFTDPILILKSVDHSGMARGSIA